MRVQLLMAQSAERELGMAWLWPERLDIEVPAAVCTAATMGALGRIPVETRIAPKSENWQLSPHRRGVGELCASIGRVFCSSPGRHRRALTTRLGFVHGNGALPCTNPAGVRWACRLRPGELQNTRCATTAEVKILHWGTAQLEMTSPTAKAYVRLLRAFGEEELLSELQQPLLDRVELGVRVLGVAVVGEVVGHVCRDACPSSPE